MEIKEVANIVKNILETNKEARENDNLLYIEVVYAINPNLVTSNFRYVFENARDLGIPPFESVSRSRRKLQEQHEELRASKKMQEAREDKQEEILDYVREVK